MTKCILSFLIAFKNPNLDDAKKKDKNFKNENHQKQIKFESMETLKINELFNMGKKLTKEPEIDCRSLKSFDILQCCHIEYTFIPNKFSYSADIIFCGNMAEIHAECGVYSQRVFNCGDVSWCLFTLVHEMNLNNNDIVTLYNSYVTVKLCPDTKMLSQKAKSYKPDIYYLKSEHVDKSIFFAPLYREDPLIVDPDPIEDNIKDLLSETLIRKLDPDYKINKLLKQEMYYHKSRAIVLLNRINSNRNPAPYRATIPNYFPEAVKRDKTSEKLKSKSFTNKSWIVFTFPGEMIFTDHKEILLETDSNLMLRSYVLITVEDLLTFEQRLSFNPLMISISEIVNLPVEQLKQDGYEQIYIKYEVPGFDTIFTHLYPIASNIKINEGRAFLTYKCDMLTLINVIQSDRIYMEVRGVRNLSPKQPFACLFGQRYFDNDLNRTFNKRIKSLYDYTIAPPPKTDNLLCIAPISFTHPITTAWSYSHSQTCYTDDAVWQCQNFSVDHHRTIITVNDINFSTETTVSSAEHSVLDALTLLDLNTCVNTWLAVAAPLQLSLLTMLGTDIPFSRLFMIINCEEHALKILTLVHSYNLQINNEPKETLINCEIWRSMYRDYDDFRINYEEKSKNNRNLITGFVIDDCNKFIVFLEGVASGFMQTIWTKVMSWRENMARIWYNSDLVFKTRLYYKFLPCTAIFMITLKKSLEALLTLPLVHLKGSMPIPCWQAVRKLNFLLLQQSKRLTVKYQLFPSADELLSLNLELGIPINESRYAPFPQIYKTLCMDDATVYEILNSI